MKPKIQRVEGGRFEITFRYDPTMVSAVREIPGRRYNPETKAWSFPDRPASMEAARAFAEEFGATWGDGAPDEVVSLAPVASARPTPTDEQAAVIGAASTGHDLKVAAYAGAGKTSTLVLVAEVLAPKKGLYVAFNANTAREAEVKFPQNVKCSTIHALAYRAMDAGKRFGARLGKRNLPSHLASIIGISEAFGRSQINVVRAVQATVRAFCNSSSEKLSNIHVPWDHLSMIQNPEDRDAYAMLVAHHALRLWVQMNADNEAIGVTHDTYLKLWQLSQPVIKTQFIMIDEAQDLNPVTLDIISKQLCQKIWVGDTHQQIYSWRGAVNAMDIIQAPEYHITQSFRWGTKIADIANLVLALKGKDLPHPVRGFDKKETTIGPVTDGQHTIITRGNARLFRYAVDYVRAGRKISVVGSLDDALRMMESAYALSKGDLSGVTHPDMKIYQGWSEVLIAAEDDHTIKQVVRQVEDYSDDIPEIIEQLREAGEVSEARADVVLTTAHRSKGREWDQVVLADDYMSHIEAQERGDEPRIEEINILYVAATRAMNRLQTNSSVDELFPEVERPEGSYEEDD